MLKKFALWAMLPALVVFALSALSRGRLLAAAEPIADAGPPSQVKRGGPQVTQGVIAAPAPVSKLSRR